MTNVEKYLDDLKYIWKHAASGIAINRTNDKPVACEDIPCVKCALYLVESSCLEPLITWMFKEAKEDKEWLITRSSKIRLMSARSSQ